MGQSSSDEPLFCIEAQVGDGRQWEICTFDPAVIREKIEQSLPEAEFHPGEACLRTYEYMRDFGRGSNSVPVAVNDMQRRSPVWSFRLPCSGDQWVNGQIERYVVSFRKRGPFPEPVRSRLLQFVESLRFAACVTITHEKLIKNNRYPV